jgi:hypothetical protein
MLISLRKRFIFVANLKTASTAIEKMLRPHCEVAIIQARYGKHASLGEIQERFRWIHEYHAREEFLVFGVIRDPVDYVVSLYNSHMKTAFEGQRIYTGDLAFAEFWTSWNARNSRQLQPQWERFVNREGKFDVDFLIDYRRLDQQLPEALRLLDVPFKALERANVSPGKFSRDAIPPDTIEHIYARYAEDHRHLRESTGRLLRTPVASAA